MYKRKLLKFAVTAMAMTALLASGAQAASKNSKKSGNIAAKVENSYKKLIKNLDKEKNLGKKFALVDKFKKATNSLRDKSPRQKEQDEVDLNLLDGALGLLPSESEFDSKKCGSYRSSILFNMAPREPELPPVPVSKALEILKSLCKD